MNKLLLTLTGLAFISLAPVQAGEGCGGCKNKDKEKTEKKEEGSKS